MLSTAREPETIHDFGGFPEELYKISYPAPWRAGFCGACGQPAQVERPISHQQRLPRARPWCLGAAAADVSAADVPVTQLSIQPSLDAAHHLRVGAALAPLTQDGVLIIGSGHMTHNLRDWMAKRAAARFASMADGAARSLREASFANGSRSANEQRSDRLVRWRELAPHALRAHPTPEHLMPLFVAFGASAREREAARRAH